MAETGHDALNLFPQATSQSNMPAFEALAYKIFLDMQKKA